MPDADEDAFTIYWKNGAKTARMAAKDLSCLPFDALSWCALFNLLHKPCGRTFAQMAFHDASGRLDVRVIPFKQDHDGLSYDNLDTEIAKPEPA